MTPELLVPLVTVFVAYLVAGKLGQATTNIRSSNLGPVWPAYGVALAAFLAYGYRIWPAVAASAVLVAWHAAISPVAAAGQAAGATLAAMTGTWLLRRIAGFDPALPRLRDALGLIVFGAFGSALISSLVGLWSLYATGVHSYAGLFSAWLIYWLGDSTGVLLVTPLVFTLPPLLRIPSRGRRLELGILLTLLTAACFLIFGDWPLFPIALHVLAFAVLPFVMWGAINFGIGGAALSVFWIATIATLLTALGSGPFAQHTPFVNAVLLDVLFIVLSTAGLTLAAVIGEREQAERQRAAAIREQTAMEARLRLAAIVESSEDAIWSQDLDGVIQSWNEAAHRIFGFTAAEAVGRRIDILVPADRWDEEAKVLNQIKSGERIVHRETKRFTKTGTTIDVSVTVSPIRNAAGELVGLSKVARDVSDQMRAREALAAVNRRLIEAQEQERSRIARELHDDIGQRLALLAARLTAHGEARTDAARLQPEVAEIAADVHALSHELHSSKLELLGVEAAVRVFCEEFAEQHGVTVAVETRDVPGDVPADAALVVYRIVQEALHNAARHSGVRRFEVSLSGRLEEIHLVIADAGSGFDVDAVRKSRGIGLISMQERIKLVSGDLTIESAPRHGTTVRARVPLAAPPSAQV